jgi:hypothetical protein
MISSKVLIIDGPARGRIYEVSSHRFLVAIDMPLETLGDIQKVAYNVHKFFLLGRTIRIASTKVLADDISEADAFEAIASPNAKEASML